jgi:aminoglycoside phosphotransferase (APT) family kinase protein
VRSSALPGRRPRREGHSLEAKLLPALARSLPVAVPQPRWRVEPGDERLPFGAIGYVWLPGRPLAPERLPPGVAAELGRCLGRLHRFPVEEAERLGVPLAPRPADRLARAAAVAPPALRERLAPDEYRTLGAWWRDVEADRELDRFAPALVHRDLWYAHVLVDGTPARLAGIVDWEAAAIGDPAQDLAVQRYLGEEFATAVLEAYPGAESGLEHRIRRYWELRELSGLVWALEHDDEHELEDALRKLRSGPIVTRGTRGTR